MEGVGGMGGRDGGMVKGGGGRVTERAVGAYDILLFRRTKKSAQKAHLQSLSTYRQRNPPTHSALTHGTTVKVRDGVKD